MFFEELFNDYLHPDITNEMGRSLQLDLFFPNLNLAFEYQGEQVNLQRFSNSMITMVTSITMTTNTFLPPKNEENMMK